MRCSWSSAASPASSPGFHSQHLNKRHMEVCISQHTNVEAGRSGTKGQPWLQGQPELLETLPQNKWQRQHSSKTFWDPIKGPGLECPRLMLQGLRLWLKRKSLGFDAKHTDCNLMPQWLTAFPSQLSPDQRCWPHGPSHGQDHRHKWQSPSRYSPGLKPLLPPQPALSQWLLSKSPVHKELSSLA